MEADCRKQLGKVVTIKPKGRLGQHVKPFGHCIDKYNYRILEEAERLFRWIWAFFFFFFGLLASQVILIQVYELRISREKGIFRDELDFMTTLR